MTVAISMVLLRDRCELKQEELQTQLAAQWPDLPAPSDFKRDKDVVSFKLGEEVGVAVALMPAPFPWSDLEGPCATSLLWKNATDEVKQHRFHSIVTVFGKCSPLEFSTVLTKVTAAVMAACPSAMGVYWGNAAMIIPKDLFIEMATKILPHQPPLHLWVDFRIVAADERGCSGFTCGLAALGHKEMEAEHAPEGPGALRERFLSIAHYLLQNGPVIRDGDTVGESAQEKIRVVESPSKFGHDGMVMRFEWSSAAPKKPWWKFW